ncbi:hypothetical protein ANCDUO_17366 [Ancylostoma duodenale]|uniref:Uncharacterized protein n=1 Tax=Ancylostoma duodenale TaxID=51022 RepID=A0A0C2C881_9BILA|nr:hypothetical protein ANCDUO_17366 [Ancylostoma duodenale]
MGTLEKKKIFFEEADRPPPSYYDGSLEKMPLKKVPFQTPDPESKDYSSRTQGISYISTKIWVYFVYIRFTNAETRRIQRKMHHIEK